VFLPEHPLELVVRGSIMYLALFALIRIVTRRRLGALAPTDLLVMVLIADAAQYGMAGDYKPIPDGLLLCAVIVGWATVLDWLAFRWPAFELVIQPSPLRIVKDGRLDHANMRREMLAEGEVLSLLRQNGVGDLAEVASAWLEPDGQFSVLRADGKLSSVHPTEPRSPGV
jgi:uncharacterized membrane protein YcaP (DUF421 family)